MDGLWGQISVMIGAWASGTPQDGAGWWALTQQILTMPWVRALGLAMIVWGTIWAIAWIYSGSASNSDYGPVGIRPHVARRLGRQDVVMPKLLMEMSLDGVIASCDVFYSYNDRRGLRRRVKVHTIRSAKIHISPAKLSAHKDTIYGQEVPDVATEDVCFPPFEVKETPAVISPTIERAHEYAKTFKILEQWTEDDDAPLISVSAETLNEIAAAREDYIRNAADKARRERIKPQLAKVIGPALARRLGDRKGVQQPNVVGNLVLRFRFSKNPSFILTKHPDRELKMTAWLTVLTSAFAMIMEAWPVQAPVQNQDGAARMEQSAPKPRARVQNP